jgi:hypothetical protein
VEIPQQGDVHTLWKTEATQALPGLRLSSNSGHGDSGTENCQKARSEAHFSTPLIGD